MKTCTRCGESKPLDEYHRNKRKKDGRDPHCKACAKAYYQANRERILANKVEYGARPEIREKRRAYMSEWRADNEEHMAEYNATHAHLMWERGYRKRARKYGFPPVIERFTEADLIARYGDACFHCGGPFDEIDHYPVPVVRGASHTLDSVVPSCMPCNRSSWSPRRIGDAP